MASLLQHPLLLAFVALLIAFPLAAWLIGAFRTERDEARAGIALLCAMRWNEFSRLISEVLKDRGMQATSTERLPGQDGFDLLFSRGKSRYLVQCKNGANQIVTAQTISQLQRLMTMQDAEGAIVAACAEADTSTLAAARQARIEVMAGHDLWAHVKPWVAHDQRVDAEAAAGAAKRRRLLIALLVATLFAVAVGAVATMLAPPPEPPPVDTRPASPSPHPVPTATRSMAALPDASLSEEQLASRRASALLEVRGFTRVANAAWNTRSTLQLGLHAELTDAELSALVEDTCRSLLQYEELRYTRLQIEIPTGKTEQPMQVRWRQCR